MNNVIDEVIEAFGGLSATARALGHKNATTVHSWKKTGKIPYWRITEIEAAAKASGATLPKAFGKDAT